MGQDALHVLELSLGFGFGFVDGFLGSLSLLPQGLLVLFGGLSELLFGEGRDEFGLSQLVG